MACDAGLCGALVGLGESLQIRAEKIGMFLTNALLLSCLFLNSIICIVYWNDIMAKLVT